MRGYGLMVPAVAGTPQQEAPSGPMDGRHRTRDNRGFPQVVCRASDLAKEPPMSMSVNRQILLKSRPAGAPSEDNFSLVEAPIPEPGMGRFLARTLYLSLDPYMRGRMSAGPSYAQPA